MKQKISYLLVLCMLFSLCSGFSVVANAADHSNGTQVSYTAPNETAYTVTVPAEMNPGDEGTVSVAGK